MTDENDKKHFFACKEGDLSDNEMLKIDLPDRPPVVVYKVGGKFFATDNTCTHGEASLAEGVLGSGGQGQWQLDEADLAALFAPLQ